jgi:DNA polymerase-3 subunit epsilon
MTDLDGITHLNSLVKPVYPIPSDATKIHGITNEMVANAPAWPVVCMRMMRVLAIRPILVIYNEQYDLRLINQSSQKHDMSVTIAHPKNCAMLQYSAYVGDWNYSRCSYRWQKLTGGDYSAKGDCIATAALIRRMAETKLSEE